MVIWIKYLLHRPNEAPFQALPGAASLESHYSCQPKAPRNSNLLTWSSISSVPQG